MSDQIGTPIKGAAINSMPTTVWLQCRSLGRLNTDKSQKIEKESGK